MLTDKLTSVVLGILLAASMVVHVILCIHNWQLSHELSEANSAIAQHEKNTAVLGEAVKIQNQAVDQLIDEADKSIQKSERALAELKPFVEEEERRILGIRSAQQSSVSQDSAERLEKIRQKMLKDALL